MKTSNQDKFMNKETKVSHVLPGGRGSGKKAHPLFMKRLKRSDIPFKYSESKGKLKILKN